MINPDSYLLNIESKLQRIAGVMKNQYQIEDIIEKENLVKIELASKHTYHITIELQNGKIESVNCSCSMGELCFHKTVAFMLLKEKKKDEPDDISTIENLPWKGELIKLTEIIHGNSIQPSKRLIDSKIVFLVELDYFGWRLVPHLLNQITNEQQRLTPTMLENIHHNCPVNEHNIISYLLYINRF
ncbi:MAG: hypothetical protein KAR38_08925, partial [Calditrichia bacterium]|nr:hypothetical protein [Calditrichia bacterium]